MAGNAAAKPQAAPVQVDLSSRRRFAFLRRWPILPGAVFVILVVCAVGAPWIAPYSPTHGNILQSGMPPAWMHGGSVKHLLGTDIQGRDILSRVIYGARISLFVAAVVLATGGAAGTLLGLVAGYAGKHVDEVIMRLVDVTMAVPFILIALVTVIVFQQGLGVVIGLLAIFSWGPFARQVRAETLSLKTRDYILLAKVSGASAPRILFRHLFPGVVNTLIVVATLRVGQLILTESILSFLGAGVPPPTADWGLMIAEGRTEIGQEWWIAFFPGVAIFLTVFATNFLGDWFRDYLDPQLRQL